MYTVRLFVNGIETPVRRVSRAQLITTVAVLLLAYSTGGSIKLEVEYVAPVRDGEPA